ncbi:hypothetical protein S7711_11133 [Stachybotrys chartarum IBT 7711]|uniref:Uncharacterized protein n=1 Tax=Stachybotrys chartarum (strain CBS 109288 / IBT 7711) TaxID=1280523 RepID=A0A084AS86_STACB|nr:hypothetical protein S7711_11133 [Stachybotrys chartarum IBT 7711]KFA76696.1 hypothetical protein S40288_10924 [Stachybotrys chartarum IBT 40288]
MAALPLLSRLPVGRRRMQQHHPCLDSILRAHGRAGEVQMGRTPRGPLQWLSRQGCVGCLALGSAIYISNLVVQLGRLNRSFHDNNISEVSRESPAPGRRPTQTDARIARLRPSASPPQP